MLFLILTYGCVMTVEAVPANKAIIYYKYNVLIEILKV